MFHTPHANQPGQPVVALFVSGRSVYRHMPNVRSYGLPEDARSFDGKEPVVAHPPCRTWSRSLRHQAKPKDLVYEQSLGLWAVEVVIRNGGVLEQPAESQLWQAARLPMPNQPAETFLYSLYVEQGWFGYYSRKPTWLLISGLPKRHLPPIPMRLVKHERNSGDLSAFGRSRTMPEFAEWLCQIARATWWQHR